MSELSQVAEAAPTPLAAFAPGAGLQPYRGSLTPAAFTGRDEEFASLIHGAAVYDLGYLTRIRMTGEDRVRWLNGMVSNTVQSLPPDHGNYTLILNAQGRIQGDGYVFHQQDHLLFETDREQAPRLLAHLDHFIIMDDVELHELDAAHSTLGLAGSKSVAILQQLGLPIPEPLTVLQTELHGIPLTLVRAYSVNIPRFEFWIESSHVAQLWQLLLDAGASPAGFEALEALRIAEGTPRYGADISERYLPQETNQSRALNFNKGCYLGQEIVERIRSRATVHRTLRQFALTGALPEPGAPLLAEDPDKPVGEITSAARISLGDSTRILALGFIRTEALERKSSITYPGGTVSPLDAPPALL